MRKLLRADLSRLFGNRIFLVSIAVMFAAGTALPVIHYFDGVRGGESWTPDTTCFVFAFIAPILLSLVTSLFIGSEHSDGTMRNKLIVGHKRRHIYLSHLISCGAAGILLCVSYLIPHTCFGILLLGAFVTAPGKLLLYAGVNIALIIAFAALFVLIAMLCRNRAYSAAGCILLVFALLFAGIRITAALNEPEYFSGFSYTENGVTTTEEPQKNPNYLSGTRRQVYEFLRDFVPGGQAIRLANMNAEKPAVLALYDGMIVVAAAVIGLAAFRRRDLK